MKLYLNTQNDFECCLQVPITQHVQPLWAAPTSCPSPSPSPFSLPWATTCKSGHPGEILVAMATRTTTFAGPALVLQDKCLKKLILHPSDRVYYNSHSVTRRLSAAHLCHQTCLNSQHLLPLFQNFPGGACPRTPLDVQVPSALAPWTQVKKVHIQVCEPPNSKGWLRAWCLPTL